MNELSQAEYVHLFGCSNMDRQRFQAIISDYNFSTDDPIITTRRRIPDSYLMVYAERLPVDLAVKLAVFRGLEDAA